MSRDKYDNPRVRSSIASIEEFFERSAIWQDIKDFGFSAIEDLHIRIEKPTTSYEDTLIIRGEIMRVRDFLALESDLLETKKLQDESDALEAEEKKEMQDGSAD